MENNSLPYQFEHDEIRREFLDGIEEVYGTLLTSVSLEMLDVESTVTNVYDEAPEKVYKEPIQVISRVVLSISPNETADRNEFQKATFTVPTKQLITNEIPHITQEELEALKGVRITFNGIQYLVDLVVPSVCIADIFQFYAFQCTRAATSSLTESDIDEGEEPEDVEEVEEDEG